jgi:hypothetical protein
MTTLAEGSLAPDVDEGDTEGEGGAGRDADGERRARVSRNSEPVMKLRPFAAITLKTRRQISA